MKYIAVEYNQDLKPLEAILMDVKHPGDFFIAGAMEIPMPRVEVDGVGMLSFPVPRPQIKALVQQATQAPYGRGEETIVDTSVRNVWQITPGAVKISGKSWPASFEHILSKVTTGLGCQDATVSAELYKLLVYDRGGFFLAHRDTEKAAGMFGTLVLTLPAAYRGGALRIRHADREVTVETNANDPSEISFAAFYADCEHEVLPVQEGSRVCLVYNLMQTPKENGRQVVEAPDYGRQVAEAAAVLSGYWKRPGGQPKIAWLLDHQYSPAGLSFSSLKGADAAKAQVLVQAAGRAECVAHLGVVHIGESGAAEYEVDDYYGSRRRRYRGYYQRDEDEEIDEAYSAVTVDDAWRYLDEWRDTEDRDVAFGQIPLEEGELLPAGALDGESPDEERLTEATGNAGATYERSYHRAALVLWPANRTVDVLLEGGVVAALPYLERLSETSPAEAAEVARHIVEAWPKDDAGRWDRYSLFTASPESSHRARMFSALVELNTPELLEQFVRDIVAAEFDGSENEALVASIRVLGENRAAAVLSSLVEARMGDRPCACAELLLALPAGTVPSFRQVAEAAVAGLDGVGKVGAEPEFIQNLLSGLWRHGGGTLCGSAAEKIASRPEVFDPVTLVVPAIEGLWAEQDSLPTAVAGAIWRLWSSSAEYLLNRSEVPPCPPSDWSLPAELSCTCADCLELQAFARNPDEKVHRFRVRMERRGHLHRMIDQHKLDMTHVTERAGSPQTLVCTKDRRTFKARMLEYAQEIDAMRKLVEPAPKPAACAMLSERMETAIKASK